MINIKEHISNLNLIDLKLNVPQVGSNILIYNTLDELEQNILYDFIIDIDGNLLIGKGHYKLNNKRNKLYFAGRLMLKNGKISYIDNDSGHYIPTEKEILDIAYIFNNINISEDLKIKVY